MERLFRCQPAVKSLDDVVRKRDEARIADHAIGFIAHEVPDRKVPLFLEDMVERTLDVIHPLRLDERHQRHGCPVGIP